MNDDLMTKLFMKLLFRKELNLVKLGFPLSKETRPASRIKDEGFVDRPVD